MSTNGRGIDLTLPISDTEAAQLRARIVAQTERRGECVVWVGYQRNEFGHGAISVHNRPVWVHRLAFALANGPIRPGQVVCHRCDVPSCVRPEHLVLGEQADNVADMRAKGRARYVAVRGERHGRFRVTDDIVAEVRRIYDVERPRQRDLAARLGLTQGTVWAIVHRAGRFAGVA